MLKGIIELSNLLGVDLLWLGILIGVFLLSAIVRCLYPWKPKYKSKKTKDKNDNEITIYYHMNK